MTVLHNGIESEIFWEAIMKKMDGENIYRYLPLNETALLLNALLQHPVYQNHSLTKKLIQVVYQQKKYYLAFPDTRNIIREILFRLDELKSSEPQLTEAFKEIV
jgi:RecJ-like exonuclease